jgi:hypothetical protein
MLAAFGVVALTILRKILASHSFLDTNDYGKVAFATVNKYNIGVI